VRRLMEVASAYFPPFWRRTADEGRLQGPPSPAGPEIYLLDRWPLAAIEDVVIATEPKCHGLKSHTHRIILSDDPGPGEGMLALAGSRHASRAFIMRPDSRREYAGWIGIRPGVGYGGVV
jgi:hypothetical protein